MTDTDTTTEVAEVDYESSSEEPLTKEAAEQVYSLLVEHVGAPERDRERFIHYQTLTFATEWRFCGSLGFGGKFRRSLGRKYVDCYQENLTERRQAAMDRVNAFLKNIK